MISPRVPPNNVDAERYLLSGILLDSTQEALDVTARVLRPEHWYDPAHREIYRAALELSAGGTKPDAATVATWLRERGLLQQCGGTVFLARIVDETPATADSAEKLASIILDHFRLRELIAAAQWIVAEGYAHQASVDDFAAQAEGRIAAAGANTARPDTAVSARDVAAQCIQLATDRSRGKEPVGIPWGVPGMTRMMGPKTDGDIYVVAGRPGMGKTGLVIQDARYVASLIQARRGVLVFSAEMPRDQIGFRAIAQEAAFDGRRLSEGRVQDQEWTQLTEGAARFGRLPLIIDDGPNPSVSHMRAVIRRAVRTWKRTHPDVELAQVVIDHIQFVGYEDIPREKCGNDNTIISAIMRKLKALAKELKIPIVLVAHLSRKCDGRTDKRPMLSDLRDSGSIEQDATGVVFLYREDHYTDGDSAPELKGVAELLCRKGRNTGSATTHVKFLAPHAGYAPLERVDYGADEADEYSDDFEDGSAMEGYDPHQLRAGEGV